MLQAFGSLWSQKSYSNGSQIYSPIPVDNRPFSINSKPNKTYLILLFFSMLMIPKWFISSVSMIGRCQLPEPLMLNLPKKTRKPLGPVSCTRMLVAVKGFFFYSQVIGYWVCCCCRSSYPCMWWTRPKIKGFGMCYNCHQFTCSQFERLITR